MAVADDESPPNPLPAHPLLVGLAASLVQGAGPAAASHSALAHADLAPHEAEQGGRNREVDELAVQPRRRPPAVVAGYLGGCVPPKGKPVMQVLYLDARLATWLLVRLDDIVLFSRVVDDTAAFRKRDILWLRPDAVVVRGDETDAVERSYLNGPFVRVDDIAPTVSGGTVVRAGGLLLEATTPACCTKTRP